MANISFDNLQTISINAKQVKKLFVQGKEIPLSVDISFDTNMASGMYYYISGQSGTATTVAPPASIAVSRGLPIGNVLPSFGNYTYILSSVTYTIYVIGWYLEPTLTTQVTASWVPTGDTTLYAKWKMTANVAISASITVPKFATSVSWTCKSNGGGRTAVSRSHGDSFYTGFAMAAPGAGQNTDTYTWTGAIQGKALTLAAQSCSLNGVTRSVTTPGNGATASGTYRTHSKNGDYIGSGSSLTALSVTVFNSNNLKCIVTAPAMSSSGTRSYTANFYYANSPKGSYVFAQLSLLKERDTEQNTYDWKVNSVSNEYSTRSTTFASGNTGGAAGAYGVTKWSSGTVSLTAASGTGYTRSVSVNA